MNKEVDKAVPEELRIMISNDVKAYKGILKVESYKTRIFYQEKSKNSQYDTYQNNIIAASATVDNRYLTADFYIYPVMVEDWKNKKLTDDNIHDIISHEVSHIVTHNLYKLSLTTYKGEEEVKDAWEALTTTIGRLADEISILKDGLTNSK